MDRLLHMHLSFKTMSKTALNTCSFAAKIICAEPAFFIIIVFCKVIILWQKLKQSKYKFSRHFETKMVIFPYSTCLVNNYGSFYYWFYHGIKKINKYNSCKINSELGDITSQLPFLFFIPWWKYFWDVNSELQEKCQNSTFILQILTFSRNCPFFFSFFF